jgi:hypothetical protein
LDSVTPRAAMMTARTSSSGNRFIEAWKRARIIVDSGGGHSTAPTPTSTPRPRPRIRKIKFENAKRPSETEAAFILFHQRLDKPFQFQFLHFQYQQAHRDIEMDKADCRLFDNLARPFLLSGS